MQGETKKVRIVAMSDTHDLHFKVDFTNLPKADIFIHAGDFTKLSTSSELLRFRQFLNLLPYKHKIVIAGNHDFALDKIRYEQLKSTKHALYQPLNSEQQINKLKKVCTYLQHQAVEVQGVKFFGSPYSLQFCHWGFMYAQKDADKLWQSIPIDTDVLITHGPPYGILDKNYQGVITGCKSLLQKVQKIKPKFHIFGHIHEGYGQQKNQDTTFINATSCNLCYKLVNKPIVFEIQVKK